MPWLIFARGQGVGYPLSAGQHPLRNANRGITRFMDINPWIAYGSATSMDVPKPAGRVTVCRQEIRRHSNRTSVHLHHLVDEERPSFILAPKSPFSTQSSWSPIGNERRVSVTYVTMATKSILSAPPFSQPSSSSATRRRGGKSEGRWKHDHPASIGTTALTRWERAANELVNECKL